MINNQGLIELRVAGVRAGPVSSVHSRVHLPLRHHNHQLLYGRNSHTPPLIGLVESLASTSMSYHRHGGWLR